MIRKFGVVAMTLLLAGCATAAKYPDKRPLTEQGMQIIGKATVVLEENVNGVEKSWFAANTSGAPYRLIVEIAEGVTDNIINAGPDRRARKAANEIAELVPAEMLNAGFVRKLQELISRDDGRSAGVAFSEVSAVSKILAPGIVKDAVEISTSYTLSDDASTFRFIARVTYNTDRIKYVSPYTVPKRDEVGPVYSNVFSYESARLPIPTITPELEERLKASIEADYRNDAGSPPRGREAKNMAKELEIARNGNLDNDEITIFLAPEWIKNNAAMLKEEIENAHAFAAKYILQDLNTTVVPRIDGQDEVLETRSDQRTVRRIGSAAQSGSYVSSPGNVPTVATYGNTISISKLQSDKIRALRNQAQGALSKSVGKK